MHVAKQTLPLADPELLAAMDHPYRVHIMGVLNQRVASQGEIAKELNIESNALSYHFRKLEGLGVIELVREERTSGGQLIGRFYRATVRGWIESDEWKNVDPKDQPAVTAMILANCNADLRAAITSGTIHGDDNVIARVPAAVDGEGWREVTDLLNEATRGIVQASERSAARMSPGDELIPIKVHILQMESPGPSELAIDH